MFTKTGKAKVTYDNRLVPIAYDGACASVHIDEPTIENALKGFEWKPGYLGFRFAEALSVKVKLDDDSQEIPFSRETPSETIYMFARKVISYDEFTTSARYKEEFRKAAQYPQLGLDKTLIYETEIGIKFMQPPQQKRTILIDKTGRQLWPAAKP